MWQAHIACARMCMMHVLGAAAADLTSPVLGQVHGVVLRQKAGKGMYTAGTHT
jgi:hypothetical protein